MIFQGGPDPLSPPPPLHPHLSSYLTLFNYFLTSQKCGLTFFILHNMIIVNLYIYICHNCHLDIQRTWDVQQCGMCDQQNPQISLRIRAVWSEPLLVAWALYDCSATDWTPFGVLSLKGGCRGSSESTHVKMPHCWKSHATAHLQWHATLWPIRITRDFLVQATGAWSHDFWVI